MSEKVWFITGTSRGFGREWAIAALDRGDKVAATARDIDALTDLTDKYGDLILSLALDVTDHAAATAAVDAAHAHFGRLDVVINNAGYGLFGMIEEVSDAEARAQIETNFFGALWVTQAALPHMRAQKNGHILQVSSIAGISAFMGTGLYAASKWALEGFSQSLAQEVAPFGIKVTLIEPGGFSTDWGGSSGVHANALSDYDGVKELADTARKSRVSVSGDPVASGAVLLKIVDADEPPLRIFFGAAPLAMAKADYASRLATWEKWNALSIEAQG
ncbi:SDR family oxidoreductase [Cryobacterium sp. TMS1-13-1]|uniref:SDR family oxidoreductase n=1 Tax=Cryobacterium sp. TMS1-13-1 TaxID=1259220 RepID=UPI001068DE36|nr:SDR family oxidoreductase [Cryobacterium sp. TMS1-13-1]TFD23384.1 SDR family oxidoreductase [Cryobacterium sp. TMS1-13-1]